MYFDSERNAYIDQDTGEVVFQEDADLPVNDRQSRSNQYQHFATDDISPRTNRSQGTPSSASTFSRTKSAIEKFFFPASTPATASRTSMWGSPRSNSTSHQHLPYIDDGSGLELGHIDIGNEVILEGGREDQKTSLADDLYNIHMNNSYDQVQPTERAGSGWDDWTLARALQALEFEIPQETNPYEDFNNKEYNASKSCRRQLLTISFFICVVQIALMIAMFEYGGTASQSDNSAIGPPAYIMVRFGAKESALIVYKNEYWRLLSSIMLHAGIIHIVPNVLIQLRIGGYLNLVYGTWRWMWIYFISGIFGEILSCLFIPDAVGVGSSGALMGLLGSWVVFIIIRWQKIPPECRTQRNCQLFTVVAAIVVTLATSFMPAVDYAAHAGGAFQGALWGVVLLGGEMEQGHKQQVARFTCAVIALTTYAYAIYYLVVDLKPSDSSLSYWAQNDDWHR